MSTPVNCDEYVVYSIELLPQRLCNVLHSKPLLISQTGVLKIQVAHRRARRKQEKWNKQKQSGRQKITENSKSLQTFHISLISQVAFPLLWCHRIPQVVIWHCHFVFTLATFTLLNFLRMGIVFLCVCSPSAVR